MTAVSTELRVQLPLTRLFTTYALLVVGLSAWNGFVTAVKDGIQLTRFGAIEFLPVTILTLAARDLGPSTCIAAALVAALVWTHPVDAEAARFNVKRAAPWLVVAAVVCLPLAILLVVASGMLTAHWVHGLAWAVIASPLKRLGMENVAETIIGIAADAGLACALSWYAFPAMARRSWSLLQKLVVIWASFAILRSAVSLLEFARR